MLRQHNFGLLINCVGSVHLMQENMFSVGIMVIVFLPSFVCQVKGMVSGEDRPPILGLQSAKNVALARELVNRGMVK